MCSLVPLRWRLKTAVEVSDELWKILAVPLTANDDAAIADSQRCVKQCDNLSVAGGGRAAGRRDANAWRCLRTLHLIQQCRTTRNQEHCYLGKVERWCYSCGRFTYIVGGTFRTSFRIGQKFLRVNLQGELRLRTIGQNGWTRFRICQNWTWQSTCWAVDTGRTLWCGKKACRRLYFGVLSFSVQFCPK